MATKHTCVQGDHYSYDYYCTEIGEFDADWYGIWAIVDILGSSRNTLATGSLVKSTDNLKFELRVLPSDTTPIPVGTYKLVVQVSNDAIQFNKEIVQEEFKITAQGA